MTTKTRKRKQAPMRLTRAARLKELRALIGLCFGLMEERFKVDGRLDEREVANAAGLCSGTIRRLLAGDYGLGVRWSTVQALAAVAGLKVDLAERGCEVSLVD